MYTDDIAYLQQALELAQIQRGSCAPNPAVGAVIVRDNKVLATGYHLGPGQAHAEVAALQKLTLAETKGATIYVTLEPCCHQGRTPPCTDALIASGVARVVYGYQDPNPVVASRGQRLLEENGIPCELISHPEIEVFYESYRYWHETKKPFITAKIAMSLDGRIAAENGDPVVITGEELKVVTHLCRQVSDAILTTARTVINDDPQLNVRLGKEAISKPLYVLDSNLSLPLSAKIFKTAKNVTLFHKKDVGNINNYKAMGVRCVAVEFDKNGLSLANVIDVIGADGMHDLWIEAGGKCFSAFVQDKLLQRALIYVAPKWLGKGLQAFDDGFNLGQTKITWKQLGTDVLAEVHW